MKTKAKFSLGEFLTFQQEQDSTKREFFASIVSGVHAPIDARRPGITASSLEILNEAKRQSASSWAGHNVRGLTSLSVDKGAYRAFGLGLHLRGTVLEANLTDLTEAQLTWAASALKPLIDVGLPDSALTARGMGPELEERALSVHIPNVDLMQPDFIYLTQVAKTIEAMFEIGVLATVEEFLWSTTSP